MWDLLGLQDHDEFVYRNDIARPGSSPEQASLATGLPEAVIDSSRDRLISAGLLYREPSGGVRAIANGPAVLIERLRGELDAELARKQSRLGQVESELTRLLNEEILAAPQTAESLVDRIPSLDAATVRIKELMCSARAEVARLDPGTDMLWSSSADPTIQPEIRASERGVDVRAICPPAQISDPAHRRSVDGQLDAGVRIRVMPTPDIRLFVVDRCVAVLADHRRAGAKDALLIRDHLLVHLLRHTFETWWVHARDVGVFLADGAARPAAEVTGEERVLLHLLSHGLKDETVAKKLGISVRTVRRKMSDVSRRLPADNRFQAGVLAARRGWL